MRTQNEPAQQPVSTFMDTVQVKISRRVVTKALAIKPDYDTNAAHLSRLLESAIDGTTTLIKQPAPQGEAVLSLKAVNKEEEERAREASEFSASIKSKPTGYTPGFTAFWKTYQACPKNLKVAGQSKPKAFEAYKAALKTHSAEDLQQAAQKAVEGQLESERRDEWAAPLPDAFRWLRDGKFELMLEDHAPAQTKPSHWL